MNYYKSLNLKVQGKYKSLSYSSYGKLRILRDKIERHRYLYYNEQPEISDAKYDSLEEELNLLDPSNPLLFTIGIDSSELYTKREHIIPMTSQDKVYNEKDFTKSPKNFQKTCDKRFLNSIV